MSEQLHIDHSFPVIQMLTNTYALVGTNLHN